MNQETKQVGIVNRSMIREKVFQSIYTYQIVPQDIEPQKNLDQSFESIGKIYFLLFEMLFDIVHLYRQDVEARKNKHLKTQRDIDEKGNLLNNSVLQAIYREGEIQKNITGNNLNWSQHHHIVNQMYEKVKVKNFFEQYALNPNPSIDEDKKVLIKLFDTIVYNSNTIAESLEEQSIFWADSTEYITRKIISKIKTFDPEQGWRTPSLFYSPQDRLFSHKLLEITIKEYEQKLDYIKKYLVNWEIDRVPLSDIIVLQMATTELLKFKDIAPNVVLSEYIKLSMNFCQESHSAFINAALDKINKDLKSS